jgi:hypothetical protein
MPRRHPLLAEALVCTALAAATAGLLAWIAPPGGDLAAHLYQRQLFLRHGFTFWDNYWYAGRYVFVGYSVIYYPLAAWLGIKLLAVLTVAVSAAAFSALLGREWGAAARWPGAAFAVLWAGVLVTGEFPFALGIALALVALVALQWGRRWIGAVLIVLTVAASPVAFVLLVVALVGTRRLRAYVPAAAVAIAAIGELVALLLFPAGGTLGFPWVEAVEAIAFCVGGIALAWGAERASLLRNVLAVYLAAVLASWAVPSGLGHDVARVRFLALPLVLLLAALRRWRPLPVVVAAVVLAGAWNIAPLAAQWTASDADGSSSAAVWRAPVAWLRAHLRPGYRVEAVDTSQHWPAWYLAGAGIPIARGWFRQDDFPFNDVLYHPLTRTGYALWLDRLGVAYVVLTRFPPDHTARAEAKLVPTFLHRVFATPDVAIYAVPNPDSIVGGGARAVALRQASIVLDVHSSGDYPIRVRWSPYWHTSAGKLSESDGMLDLKTPARATVRLWFSP